MNNAKELKLVDVDELSLREINSLRRAGLETLGDVAKLTDEELSKVRYLSKPSIEKIKGILEKYVGTPSFTQEDIDAFYEEYCATCVEEESRIAQQDREKLVQEYMARYCNEKGIKKYAKVDAKKVRAAFAKVSDPYLSALYHIIRVNDVQFSVDRSGGAENVGLDDSGNIRTKVFSRVGEGDVDILMHELGHAAANALRENKDGFYPLVEYINPNGETLAETLSKEIAEVGEQVKTSILQAHRLAVEPKVGEDVYRTVGESADFLREFQKVSRSVGAIGGIFIPNIRNPKQTTAKFAENKAKYGEMFSVVCDKKLIAKRNKLVDNKAHKEFRLRNEAVLDVLSSVYDMEYPYDLQIHSKSYYDKDKGHQAGELWANLFALHALGKKEEIEIFKQYFPKTYDKFELVLMQVVMFYIHEGDKRDSLAS